MFERLAQTAWRRPKVMLGVAGLAVAIAVAFGGNVQSRLRAAAYEPQGGAQSVQARELLDRALGHAPDPLFVVLASSDRPVRSSAVRREVGRVAAELRARPRVGAVETYLDGPSRALVSKDGHSTLLAVYTRDTLSANRVGDVWQSIARGIDSQGLKLRLGGFGPGTKAATDIARKDLIRAELISFPILLLLLLIIFRGVIAALVPIVVALTSTFGAFLGLRLIDDVSTVSIFALNVATALGLGLSIDYSLLLVSRYREEIERTGVGLRALTTTLTTAGRTVFLSGLTVAAALGALLIFPGRLIYSFGYGGALVALTSVGAALLVTTPLLALLGERINAFSLQKRAPTPLEQGSFYRIARVEMGRPVIVVLISAGLLLALGIPLLRINYTGQSPDQLPRGHESRKVDDALHSQFPLVADSLIDVAVLAPPGRQSDRSLRSLQDRIASLPTVVAVTRPRRLDNDTVIIQVGYRDRRYTRATNALVSDIRGLQTKYQLLVGGLSAELIDFRAEIRRYLLPAFAIVAVAMLVFVFLMTGSAILPFKMIVTSIVTISATFGLLVLIFQDGRLEGLLDYTSNGGVDTALSVFILASAFGLSTDYGMFLIARVREFHVQGLPNEEAIARALQQTGGVITGAMALLCVAFGAIATSSLTFLKETGVGTAFAIAIDATIVRVLLVPALMRLMGRWNWWAPRPLRALREPLGIERRIDTAPKVHGATPR